MMGGGAGKLWFVDRSAWKVFAGRAYKARSWVASANPARRAQQASRTNLRTCRPTRPARRHRRGGFSASEQIVQRKTPAPERLAELRLLVDGETPEGLARETLGQAGTGGHDLRCHESVRAPRQPRPGRHVPTARARTIADTARAGRDSDSEAPVREVVIHPRGFWRSTRAWPPR